MKNAAELLSWFSISALLESPGLFWGRKSQPLAQIAQALHLDQPRFPLRCINRRAATVELERV